MGPLGITILYDPGCGETLRPGDGHYRCAFDLVAVHGLNGDAFDTWTHGKTSKMWLRDMLPAMLPDTRIMTYGYNAKFANFTSTQDLYSTASKLLSELVDFRTSEEARKRPIVFVCHSLGGIVTKKALIIRPTDEQQRAVQESTYGVIFMGTPHSGSDLASYGSAISRIVKVCTPYNPATLLLHDLRKESRILFELSRDFAQQMQKLSIITFYEMDKTNFVLKRSLVVDMDSAILRTPNEIAIPQNANHIEITKFSDDKDANYRPVLSRLLALAQDMSTKMRQVLCLDEPDKSKTPNALLEPLDRENFTFRGREDVLTSMAQFFAKPPPETRTPLVFVITGLGGLGKTSTAVQYARRFVKRYSTGVFFIKASSIATIQADAARYVALLNGINGKSTAGDDKMGELSKYLGERKGWLLILDGADDLETLNLPKVFPKSKDGHIIVTTRDQTVNSSFGKNGDRLGNLDEESAVLALLDNAGVKNPTGHQIATAKRISQLLGYLPLAINQAGAYINARQKTLDEYETLFRDRASDVLRAHPRMANHEKTIMATWEVSFNYVESTSSDAAMLLSLLAFLEPGEILLDMLRHGCSDKKIWDQHGQVTYVSPTAAGMDPRFVNVVKDDIRFDDALEVLLGFSLVWRIRTIDGHSAIALHPLVQVYAAGRAAANGTDLFWQEQAILLICQAFPYSNYLDGGNFGDRGRQMFAQVPIVLGVFDKVRAKIEHKPVVRRALIIMLLSASRFNTKDHKRHVIDKAKSLLPESADLDLSTWAVERESTLLRICGERDKSYGVLENHILKLSESSIGPDGTNERINGQRGGLVIAYANNLLLDGKTRRATEELQAWEPLNTTSPSVMELDVAREKHVMLGRALRNAGNFQEAIGHYEELLKDTKDMDIGTYRTPWQSQLLQQLSDLYCEIGTPSRALKFMKVEIEQIIRDHHEKTPRGTDLLLCYAEALIRQGDLDRAAGQLQDLDATFKENPSPDMLVRTKHFRLHAGLARIWHLKERWTEAEIRWLYVLGLLERFGWKGTFNEAMTLLSLAQASYRSGQTEQAESYRHQADAILKIEGPKYWFVGLGSYWYNFVAAPLGENGPDPIARESLSRWNDQEDMKDVMGMIREWAAAESSMEDSSHHKLTPSSSGDHH